MTHFSCNIQTLKEPETRTEACRTCGADIRGRRWTQCSVCYWKSRLDDQQPLDELLRQRAEVRAHLKSFPVRIERLRTAISHRNVELAAKIPWWRKLLGEFLETCLPHDKLPRCVFCGALVMRYSTTPLKLRPAPRCGACGATAAPPGLRRSDPVLAGHWQRLHQVEDDLRHAEKEHSRIENRIQEHNKVKKRFLNAQIARSEAETRKRLKAQEHERFCSDALTNLGQEFDRVHFFIQGRDYKRGNSIDNYFRKTLSEIVIAAFEHRCGFCGAPEDLTFDHYGLPKNEGGNFVLILADKASIRLNIVVLCRGCNAMKGERSYLNYFSDAQRDQVTIYQRALLESILHDQNFLALIKKWGGGDAA